jgi:secreted trypsin-like serine protease
MKNLIVQSGGPLSARPSVGNEVYLVGIVSWGAPCNDSEDATGLPGVYVRVSKYSNWIEEIMMKFG